MGPPGVEPTRDTDVAAFLDSKMAGFFDGKTPLEAMLAITEHIARSPRVSMWLLELEGRVVGSGGLLF